MSPGSFSQLVDLVRTSDPRAKQALSGRYFQRMMALVQTRLFNAISEKDVSVLDSILESVVRNHAHDDIDWGNEECLVYLIGGVALRHCDKHDKRWRRDPERQVLHLPIGVGSEETHRGSEPADSEPPPEAVAEFADFITRFSHRQREIIQMLLDDVAVVDIANELGCVSRTVYREMQAIEKILEREFEDYVDWIRRKQAEGENGPREAPP